MSHLQDHSQRGARVCITPQVQWVIAALVAITYIALCVKLSAVVYQDYSSHLARAVVMADLIFHHGAQFGYAFQYHFMAVPYIAGDLALVALVEIFGPETASAIWTALMLLSLPLAMLLYLRVTQAAPKARAAFFMLSLYLATDWFFFSGFLNFRLAVAMTIAALALVQALRRRWSLPLFILFCVLTVVGHLMHLAFTIFLAAAVGVSGLLRLWLHNTTLRREVLFGLPILAVLAWHVLGPHFFPDQKDIVATHYVWGTLNSKLRRLDWDMVRFNEFIDVVLALAFAAYLLWPLRSELRWQAVKQPRTLEALALAVSFVGLYFAFPMSWGDPTYVDVRPLALVAPFLILACVYLAEENPALQYGQTVYAWAVGLLLVFGNLAFISTYLRGESAWLARFREVVAAVPLHSRVLPIYTLPKLNRRYLCIDCESFVVIDGRGVVAYLFSGDQAHPMKYFRYRNPPYTPQKIWYSDYPAHEVNWQALACAYDYLLVTQPYDARRIEVSTRTVAESSSAALLAIDKQQCPAPRADTP
jgi:hypothetical protein